MLLALMVFATPGLDWSPTDHCEFFAGEMAVTKGELEGPSLVHGMCPSLFRSCCVMWNDTPKKTHPQLLQEGRRALAFDIRHGGNGMDFLHPCGYSHALFQVLRLHPGAGLMLAPVCSSWVYMPPESILWSVSVDVQR